MWRKKFFFCEKPESPFLENRLVFFVFLLLLKLESDWWWWWLKMKHLPDKISTSKTWKKKSLVFFPSIVLLRKLAIAKLALAIVSYYIDHKTKRSGKKKFLSSCADDPACTASVACAPHLLVIRHSSATARPPHEAQRGSSVGILKGRQLGLPVGPPPSLCMRLHSRGSRSRASPPLTWRFKCKRGDRQWGAKHGGKRAP